MLGSPNHSFFILGQAIASPSHTRGGSRMRESRPYGSVRGARGETCVSTATTAASLLLCDRQATPGCPHCFGMSGKAVIGRLVGKVSRPIRPYGDADRLRLLFNHL